MAWPLEDPVPLFEGSCSVHIACRLVGGRVHRHTLNLTTRTLHDMNLRKRLMILMPLLMPVAMLLAPGRRTILLGRLEAAPGPNPNSLANAPGTASPNLGDAW